jgi:hypothetical protein
VPAATWRGDAQARPAARDRRAAWSGAGPWVAAAILLALATFSKPSNGLLVAPPVLLLAWRRRFGLAAGTALTFAAALVACAALTWWATGEINYQGGDRKIFYGRFPFEDAEATFETLGGVASTNELTPESGGDLLRQLARNAWYFLAGRHFGLLLYGFPAVVLVAWTAWRREFDARRWLILATAAGGALALLVLLPFTWAGGGGPIGNRYFLPFYATLLFVAPPLRSPWPILVMALGGVACTGHVVLHPFEMARHPWRAGLAPIQRRLPVELTNASDVPAMLDVHRSRIPLGRSHGLELTFLDPNGYGPWADAYGVARGTRAEVILTSASPVPVLKVTLTAAMPCRAEVRSAGQVRRVSLAAGEVVVVTVGARPVRSRERYAYVLSVTNEDAGEPPASLRRPGDPLSPPLLVAVSG